jgi:hypothetical protein
MPNAGVRVDGEGVSGSTLAAAGLEGRSAPVAHSEPSEDDSGVPGRARSGVPRYVTVAVPAELPAWEPPEPAAEAAHQHWPVVYCEQRWRWRVLVRCAACGDTLHTVPGRWWRRRRADQAVARLLARLMT